ncbi:MAG: hypothetical protein LBQ98_09650 [Nitrososphaerota archaeon]|jgi:hypothetical protein|nr:hypothetical protein [Nitrososphaerota archaeon]
MALNLPSEDFIKTSFQAACNTLGLENFEKSLKQTVIYDMTDGMRTSTLLKGADAYYDGGIFVLRLINIMRVLEMPACYINVIEEKHRQRENYSDIYDGLKRLYIDYAKYAQKYGVKLNFVGDLETALEPQGSSGIFGEKLKSLCQKTAANTQFTANFLINYSLDWAMKHESYFTGFPKIDVTIRHTKLQFPTGMMLPPSISDFSSLMYVQQGSASSTWSDNQLIYLVAVALRSKILNESTQYFKQYAEGERDFVRSQRETELYLVHRRPFIEKTIGDIMYDKIKTSSIPIASSIPQTKRMMITGNLGPEIYEL